MFGAAHEKYGNCLVIPIVIFFLFRAAHEKYGNCLVIPIVIFFLFRAAHEKYGNCLVIPIVIFFLFRAAHEKYQLFQLLFERTSREKNGVGHRELFATKQLVLGANWNKYRAKRLDI